MGDVTADWPDTICHPCVITDDVGMATTVTWSPTYGTVSISSRGAELTPQQAWHLAAAIALAAVEADEALGRWAGEGGA
jgi:hypothetical protein